MKTSLTKLKACVVGGGNGGRLSLKALHQSECFDLVAVTDLRKEVCSDLEKLYPGIKTYQNHLEMFEKSPVDVVCVSTYPPSHMPITHDALQLSLKGILVEKPLADRAQDGKKIIEAIKKKNIPMAVPHFLLAGNASREVLKRVHQGEIGKLKLVEIENTGWDIINAGIHWLNYFVALTQGDPMKWTLCSCDTSTQTYRDGMQVETMAVTYAETQSGIRVVMNTGDFVNVTREEAKALFRIIGTAGMIEFWNNQYWIQNKEFPEGKLIAIPNSSSAHQFHLENMAQMIQTGNLDYQVANSSLMALELCEGAYLSNKYRCQVNFPLDQFTPPQANDWKPGEPYSGKGGGRDGRKLT